jgi:hypothetical protein
MPSPKKMTHAQIQVLRDQHFTAMRDLATGLLDDPFDADDVVARVFSSLRRVDVASMGTDAEAERRIRGRVITACINRFATNVRRETGASSAGGGGRAA